MEATSVPLPTETLTSVQPPVNPQTSVPILFFSSRRVRSVFFVDPNEEKEEEDDEDDSIPQIPTTLRRCQHETESSRRDASLFTTPYDRIIGVTTFPPPLSKKRKELYQAAAATATATNTAADLYQRTKRRLMTNEI